LVKDLSWIGGDISCIAVDLEVDCLEGDGFVWDRGSIKSSGGDLVLSPGVRADCYRITSIGHRLAVNWLTDQEVGWDSGRLTSLDNDMALAQGLGWD
jgi:hypothetical protein